MDLNRLVSMSLRGDGLQVSVTLAERSPPPSAQGIKEDAVVAAIQELATAKSITEPLDFEAIGVAVRRWLTGGRKHELVVGKGRAAVNGSDAKVTLFRPKVAQRTGRDVGRVDKRNLGFVPNVEAGAVLATATLPATGTEGATLTGAVLPAKDGKPASITVGEGVAIEHADDHTTYRATITGIAVELSETRLSVGRTLEIGRGVDRTTGNVDAWGDVVIRGSVEEGFSVRARGDITIDGTCDSSFLDSDGDVTVGGGILGRSGHTEVRARGNVTARFVENAKVESGGDVTIKDSVINSRILAAGSITALGKGVVLASRLASGRHIAASTFGSEARLPVELVVAGDPLEWLKLARMRRMMRFLRRSVQRGTRGSARSPLRAREGEERHAKQRRTAEQVRHALKRKEQALRATLLATGGPRVIVHKVAFPKTTVRLGPHLYEVSAELREGVFAIDMEHGRITWTIGDARATPKDGGGKG